MSQYLDNLIRPEIRIFHRSWPTFQVCGYMGLALAIFLAMILVIYLHLSPPVMVVIVLAAVSTFFGLVMATKVVTGREQIIYYHHEIAVMIVTWLLLCVWRQPALPYLDVTILGIGLFLACGRVGCLMVGCCHGRPYHWGVCYRQEHASAGFTSYYIGVRLFPIQAAESLWVLCIVVVGAIFILSGHPPGTALAWYVVTYDLGRFCFEFMRGDPERPYLFGFSQAQWISFLLMCWVVWAELAGVLPIHWWHAGATAGLLVTMIAISLGRCFQRTATHQLLHPHHVKEVARAIERVSDLAAKATAIGQWTVMPKRNSIPVDIHIKCTSLGVQISVSKIKSAAGYVHHYALSHRDGGMTEETARVLAWLILQLKQATGSSRFLQGNRDTFHLLIHPGAARKWSAEEHAVAACPPPSGNDCEATR